MFHEISNKNVNVRFDGTIAPCLKANSGDYILFHTLDAHNKTINIETVFADVSFPELDETNGNPSTGPAHIEGAEPGDTLKVSILEINPEEVGELPVRGYMGILRNVVPERTARIVRYKDDRIWISDTVSVPARPMIGTIGVAPEGEGISTGPAGTHGGNMDDNLITTGAEVLFPVFIEGARLSIGDIHAAMGDAELTCGGVDICARVLVKVDVLKSTLVTDNPIVIKDNYIATHGYAQDYPEAAAMAAEEMCKILMKELKVSRYEAVVLLAARGDLGLCQACQAEAINLPMVVRCAFPIVW
jgi:amidase